MPNIASIPFRRNAHRACWAQVNFVGASPHRHSEEQNGCPTTKKADWWHCPQTPAGGTCPSRPPVKVPGHAPDEASDSPCPKTVAVADARSNLPRGVGTAFARGLGIRSSRRLRIDALQDHTDKIPLSSVPNPVPNLEFYLRATVSSGRGRAQNPMKSLDFPKEFCPRHLPKFHSKSADAGAQPAEDSWRTAPFPKRLDKTRHLTILCVFRVFVCPSLVMFVVFLIMTILAFAIP